jgi:long-chain acyl-CoA synthetase
VRGLLLYPARSGKDKSPRGAGDSCPRTTETVGAPQRPDESGRMRPHRPLDPAARGRYWSMVDATAHENVGDLLRARAAERPDAPFLVDARDGRTWSYAATDHVTDALVARLAAEGVGPGDRLGVLLPNGPELVLLYLAALKRGAVFSPINTRFGADEIGYIVGHSQPALVCTTTALADGLRRAGDRPVARIDGAAAAWFHEGGQRPCTTPPGRHDPGLLLYTSGTTGRPKGALLTHENLLVNAHEIAAWLRLDARDRMLCVMPLFHANALVVGVATPLACGASTVVCERFSAGAFWPLVDRFRPTTFGSVATILSMLLAHGPPAGGLDRRSVRFALCGSAPVPVEVMQRFREAFGIPVVEGYGLTECTCRATFNPPDAPRPGSAGLPIGNRVRIVDEAGGDCRPGVVGEVWIQGRNVMAGYFRAPEATRAALAGGWLHSGDLGYRDADGFLYLVGRKGDMIIRGGENVYPREIEDVIYRLPAVRDAAVVGVPDPLYGEAVVACVTARPGTTLSPDAVLAHCRAHLAAFKCPVAVHVLAEIPKGPTGKLLKTALRTRFGGGAPPLQS